MNNIVNLTPSGYIINKSDEIFNKILLVKGRKKFIEGLNNVANTYTIKFVNNNIWNSKDAIIYLLVGTSYFNDAAFSVATVIIKRPDDIMGVLTYFEYDNTHIVNSRFELERRKFKKDIEIEDLLRIVVSVLPKR